jgi:hypothetical protein
LHKNVQQRQKFNFDRPRKQPSFLSGKCGEELWKIPDAASIYNLATKAKIVLILFAVYAILNCKSLRIMPCQCLIFPVPLRFEKVSIWLNMKFAAESLFMVK